jgi:hypothetical protein
VHAVWAIAVLRLALRLELGPEYDTNANRAETVEGAKNVDQPTGSALVRTTARMQLQWSKGASLLRVGGGLGGKIFFNPDVADQNTFVGQLGIDERVTVARFADIGFTLDYYDASQLDVPPPCATQGCVRHRDFRSGAATARVTFVDAPGDLTVTGGYRGFQYKPDANFDFQAAQAGVAVAARLTTGAERQHEIGFAAAYHLERRWYAGPTEHNTCAPGAPIDSTCLLVGPDTRDDWFHEAAFEVSYLGPVLFSTGYALQLNRSSSFGFSLLRHIVTLKLGARLFWQIYGTLKAQVFVNSYLDPVILDRQITTQSLISIEEENRNSVIIDLERPIARTGVAVIARYSLYTNELGASKVDFIRHVVFLGVTYQIGWTR